MPTINTYLIGAVVKLTGTFTDLDGDAIDPDTVTLRIKEPDGTITVYVYSTDLELVRDGVGEYHVDWAADQAGEYCFRFEGTGVAQAVNEKQFEIDAGCFAEA
jgi:uncharacterized protein YfaS (alpha-2-macroglobulin family)